MKSVLTVIGARPQFVKAAVVSSALSKIGIREKIVHTGQHYDSSLSNIFFQELNIPEPTYHLGVGSGSHGQQTANMLVEIEKIVLEVKPDWVLVYGDTNSTIAGALAAAKHNIPIAHVEAGLRSFNRRMPEEINRITTDHLSSLLLCPTESAMTHLKNEGITNSIEKSGFKRKVELVGDVMYDATIVFGNIAEQRSKILQSQNLEKNKYILVTIHRAENTDDRNRLRIIVDALSLLGTKKNVIWPVHPRTRKSLEECAYDKNLTQSKVRLIDPVGYFDMLILEKNAECIVTDSGGVQKEAFFAKVPCITLRDETEWVELVASGWNTLVPPTDSLRIADAAMGVKPGRNNIQPYGNGCASEVIATLINT